jgi:hypothetical protein
MRARLYARPAVRKQMKMAVRRLVTQAGNAVSDGVCVCVCVQMRPSVCVRVCVCRPAALAPVCVCLCACMALSVGSCSVPRDPGGGGGGVAVGWHARAAASAGAPELTRAARGGDHARAAPRWRAPRPGQPSPRLPRPARPCRPQSRHRHQSRSDSGHGRLTVIHGCCAWCVRASGPGWCARHNNGSVLMRPGSAGRTWGGQN